MANSYGAWTLFKRETDRFWKVRTQTILAPVVSNLLYLAIFGLSLNRAIPTVQDISYLQFLVPGLIMMGLINNSYQNPSSSMIIMRYQDLISNLMIIPLRHAEMLVAFVSSAILRAFIVGTVTYLTSIFFVDFTYPAIGAIFGMALLVSLLFSFVGLIVGIWADEFDKTAFIQNFILTPLIFLGGVFYPISTLPETFSALSAYNPIVYMIDAFRYGFTGLHEFPLTLSFSVVIGVNILAGGIVYYMLKSGYKLKN